jgi:PhzF family phenazine biosynthesis protein
MELTLYQVDAFADRHFEGNPAAVIPLEIWLPDDVMQSIAEENNLSETAFFVPTEKGFHAVAVS